MEFEWDEEKARSNQRKHRVDFETAARIFLDPDRIETYDHSTRLFSDRVSVSCHRACLKRHPGGVNNQPGEKREVGPGPQAGGGGM